ncbi:hypothetical protein KAR91_10015 [Candidatus Pacearchaeota archaeon]|nr:hypothetical protein [Candidatus Pacearchaeota archaeon]
MTYEVTKTEQNQTLSKVPLGIWARFRAEAANRSVALGCKVTMTELFIDMFNHWMKTKEAK